MNTTDSKTVFQWDKKAVNEFLNYKEEHYYDWEKEITEFEQSKLKEAEVPKRVKMIKSYNKVGGGIKFEADIVGDITSTQISAIKEFMEKVLNNEVPDIPTLSRQEGGLISKDAVNVFPYDKITTDLYKQEGEKNMKELISLFENKPKDNIQDKDWEIVSVEDGVTNGFDGEGKIVVINKSDEKSWIRSRTKINSVRRLSDNTVFSEGDKVGWGIHKSYETTLLGFEIQDGRLKFNDSKRPQHLKWADFLNVVDLHKKLPPKEEVKPLLFTTEDGVDITDPKQVVYGIDDEFNLLWGHAVTGGVSGRRFSTKEAAEQYIIDNKPCLSRNEVMGVVRDVCKGINSDKNKSFINNGIYEIITQKINPTKEQAPPKQMWNRTDRIHNETIYCRSAECEEYNPLNKEHSLK